MCFSAGASFAGGTLLSAVGIATAKKMKNPSLKLFAAIPGLFAIQQFSEGILWLTLKSGGYDRLQSAATYTFLLFALIIWPTLIPLAVLKMEELKSRRKLLKALLGTGILVSAYYTFCLVTFNVEPQIRDSHIQYVNNFPEKFSLPAFGLYVIATIVPLFISSIRKMYLFGVLVFISCLITGVFYKEYLTSVWCFFAALISVVIYYIVSLYPEEKESCQLKTQL